MRATATSSPSLRRTGWMPQRPNFPMPLTQLWWKSWGATGPWSHLCIRARFTARL